MRLWERPAARPIMRARRRRVDVRARTRVRLERTE